MTNTLSVQQWLNVINREYLEEFVKEGGASVKFAVPTPDDLRPLVEDAFRNVTSNLGYIVARVDSGETRVNMPQEIFFRIAQQIDWRLLARWVVLRLCKDDGYITEGIEPAGDAPILQAVSAANSVEGKIVEERMIAQGLVSPLFQAVADNTNMARDFRLAMTHLCRAEMRGAGQNEEAVPLIDWLTGANRRVSTVRHYSIHNSIARTNARHFFESLLYWVRFSGYSGTVVILDNSRVTLRRNPRDGLHFYSRSAVMDHYEGLRQLIDSTDRLEGFLGVVLSNQDFLDDEPRGKGFVAYPPLMARIGDEVQGRNQANPLSTLVRLSDTA